MDHASRHEVDRIFDAIRKAVGKASTTGPPGPAASSDGPAMEVEIEGKKLDVSFQDVERWVVEGKKFFADLAENIKSAVTGTYIPAEQARVNTVLAVGMGILGLGLWCLVAKEVWMAYKRCSRAGRLRPRLLLADQDGENQNSESDEGAHQRLTLENQNFIIIKVKI